MTGKFILVFRLIVTLLNLVCAFVDAGRKCVTKATERA